MRLATSTCIFPGKRSGKATSLVESVAMCSECGFKVVDLNFCFAVKKNQDSLFVTDRYEEVIDELGEAAVKYGVEYSQSHAPYDSNLRRADRHISEEDLNWFYESVRRSIEASGKLGVKWVVTHAQTDVMDDEMSSAQNLKTNTEFYERLLGWAKKYGTGIAVENMAEFHPAKTLHRYTAVVDEQIDIIDAINDEDLRGAWDFGHASMVYADQTVPLRKLGRRLRATHVQENDGTYDAHLLPFVGGEIPWEKIMKILRETEYPGDFTYEVHGFFRKIPDDLRISAGKFAFETGMYLMRLYDEA